MNPFCTLYFLPSLPPSFVWGRGCWLSCGWERRLWISFSFLIGKVCSCPWPPLSLAYVVWGNLDRRAFLLYFQRDGGQALSVPFLRRLSSVFTVVLSCLALVLLIWSTFSSSGQQSQQFIFFPKKQLGVSLVVFIVFLVSISTPYVLISIFFVTGFMFGLLFFCTILE